VDSILIIDDDEIILQTTQAVLAEEGFDVLATADAPRGLEILKELRPGLVLLDLALPSMNGLEVLRKIHDIDSGIKVIVITGYSTDETSQVAIRYGAYDFLAKPVAMETLLWKVRAAFAVP
jgi:DNA-binding NtrC family response regulator